MAKVSVVAVALGQDGVELFDKYCVSCKLKHEFVEGLFHCKFCGVLCEECASQHSKTPTKKKHWATRMEILAAPVRNPTFKYLDKCEIHPENKIIAYCFDDGVLLCDTCIAEEHENCGMETVENLAADVNKEEDIRKGRVLIQDLKNRNIRVAKKKRKEMIDVANQSEKFTKYITGVRDNIVRILDEMVKTITKDKDTFCRAEGELIENDINICTEIGGILEEGRGHFMDAYKKSKPKQIWIAMKKLEQLETNIDPIIGEIENDKEMIQFEFVSNEYLKNLIEAPEALGIVKVKSSRLFGKNSEILSKMPQPPKKRWSLFGGNRNTQDNHGYSKQIQSQTVSQAQRGNTVKLSTPVNSKSTPRNGRLSPIGAKALRQTKKETLMQTPLNSVSGSKFGFSKDVKLSVFGKKEIRLDVDAYPCSVTGCTFLPSGRLVLVDNNNKNIKLLDTSSTVLSVFVLEERPWDVTPYTSTEIAVSCPFNHSVELISTGLEMKVVGQIKTDRPCHGVGYHKPEKWMYIACGEGTEAQLQAYSFDGHLRKVIIPELLVFHEPCFLTMSEDCSKVYVSDLDNGIIGFNTKSGQLISRYRDPKIKRYWDICGDEQDRLLVVTTDPDGIYLLEEEKNGHLLSTLNSSNKPCSITYGNFRKTIVITRWQSDYIESFRLVPSN